jgi:hypothetical protein
MRCIFQVAPSLERGPRNFQHLFELARRQSPSRSVAVGLDCPPRMLQNRANVIDREESA